MPHRPGNHRDQRRLIDIAPTEMTAAVQEVQLVTQVPISVSRVQIHHQLARGNQEYNGRRTQHRKQVPFVTALYRATRHLRLRLRHHPRLLQIASVAIIGRARSGRDPRRAAVAQPRVEVRAWAPRAARSTQPMMRARIGRFMRSPLMPVVTLDFVNPLAISLAEIIPTYDKSG